MKVLRDFTLLFKREFIHALRMPTWLIVGISTPLLYLALYTPLLQKLAGGPGFPTKNVLDVFLPGMLAYLAFTSGSSEGYGTIFTLKDGQIERLRVTPASRVALLLSPILSDIVWMYIFIAILVAVAIPFGFHAHVTGLLISLILLALLVIVTGAFSVTIALLTKEISTFASIVMRYQPPRPAPFRCAAAVKHGADLDAGHRTFQSAFLCGGCEPGAGGRDDLEFYRRTGIRGHSRTGNRDLNVGHPGIQESGRVNTL